MEVLAIAFLLVFVLWLFSSPRRGGHRPPGNNIQAPHKPPPKPPDAGRSVKP